MTDKIDHTKCKCGGVKPPTHGQCSECDKAETPAIEIPGETVDKPKKKPKKK